MFWTEGHFALTLCGWKGGRRSSPMPQNMNYSSAHDDDGTGKVLEGSHGALVCWNDLGVHLLSGKCGVSRFSMMHESIETQMDYAKGQPIACGCSL